MSKRIKTYSIDDDVYEMFKKVATIDGHKMSELIETWILQYIAQYFADHNDK